MPTYTISAIASSEGFVSTIARNEGLYQKATMIHSFAQNDPRLWKGTYQYLYQGKTCIHLNLSKVHPPILLVLYLYVFAVFDCYIPSSCTYVLLR